MKAIRLAKKTLCSCSSLTMNQKCILMHSLELYESHDSVTLLYVLIMAYVNGGGVDGKKFLTRVLGNRRVVSS